MRKGLVSVMLTSYNRPKMVREAIESVLNQTYPNWELFLLDDNSNKETQDVLASYCEGRPNVKIYQSGVSEEERFKRPGYVVNINAGLRLIDGEFVCYLTDDDYLLPNAFELLTTYMNQHDWADVVYGKQKLIRDGQDDGFRGEEGVLSWAPAAVDHCQVMHRSSLLARTGDWSTASMRCGDAEFWAQLHGIGCKFFPVHEPTCVHRYHTQSLSNKLDRGELKSEPCE